MGNVGKYSGDALKTYEKILGKKKSYTPNKVYKNEKCNIYYFINTHGYMHVFKLMKVGENGKIMNYTIEDLMLTKDNLLRFKRNVGKFETVQKAIEELEQMAA